MRDDLLDAQAAVDWTVAQFPSLSERIEIWLAENMEMVIKDQPAPATYDVIIAIPKEPLPRAFTIEIGAYINTIRSSLDILATAITNRYGIARPEDAYFPVAKSAASFAAGNYKGSKFIKALPPTERAIIEALNPYEGGNDLLWLLHDLEIMRKHRRLLGVAISPERFHIIGTEVRYNFTPLDWLRVDDQETILGMIAKGAPDYNMKIASYVTIYETGFAPKPIVATLNEFASLANSIINLFDR